MTQEIALTYNWDKTIWMIIHRVTEIEFAHLSLIWYRPVYRCIFFIFESYTVHICIYPYIQTLNMININGSILNILTSNSTSTQRMWNFIPAQRSFLLPHLQAISNLIIGPQNRRPSKTAEIWPTLYLFLVRYFLAIAVAILGLVRCKTEVILSMKNSGYDIHRTYPPSCVNPPWRPFRPR